MIINLLVYIFAISRAVQARTISYHTKEIDGGLHHIWISEHIQISKDLERLVSRASTARGFFCEKEF